MLKVYGATASFPTSYLPLSHFIHAICEDIWAPFYEVLTRTQSLAEGYRSAFCFDDKPARIPFSILSTPVHPSGDDDDDDDDDDDWVDDLGWWSNSNKRKRKRDECDSLPLLLSFEVKVNFAFHSLPQFLPPLSFSAAGTVPTDNIITASGTNHLLRLWPLVYQILSFQTVLLNLSTHTHTHRDPDSSPASSFLRRKLYRHTRIARSIRAKRK